MPDQLVLIRHGESEWNARGLLQGQADPPLSPLGRAQAAALAALVPRLPAERVVSSDLARASETVTGLGLEAGTLDGRWREIDVGAWSGRPVDECTNGGLPNWLGGDDVAEGGEPWAAFAARVAGALDELLAGGGPWVIVTHGGCIRAACAHLTGIDHTRLASPPNASATFVELTEPPRLVSYGVPAPSVH